MREKLKTLSLLQLKEIAKEQGFKGVSNLNKANLIDLLAEFAENQSNEEKIPETVSNNQYSEVKASLPRDNSYQAVRDNYQPSTRSNYQNYQNNQSNQRNVPYQGTQRSPQNNYTNTHNQRYNSGNYQNNYQSNYNNNYPNNSMPYNQNNYVQNTYPNNQGGYRGEYYVDNMQNQRYQRDYPTDIRYLDSGEIAEGILEIMPDGFGFIRCENFLPGDDDVYVSPAQIKKLRLKTGDIVSGVKKVKTATEKFAALLYVNTVNSFSPDVLETRPNFEDLTPIFPNSRIHLADDKSATEAMRIVDLLSPIGKGQRGMIVSQPKAGKTTLLKQVAKSVTSNYKDMHLIILLIDERPEEVTDIKEAIVGENVEVIYSTFDELPERHKRVSEMVIERAKRLVEHGKDVMILLDSITRLARAYNLTVAPSGRTLSGGLDPAALHMPKRFFGAARNMREGGSLTILATALIDTGSRMDDVVFEEFKGTGNMELVLDRKLSEKRIFPAIDVLKSSTRRDDLLLTTAESDCVNIFRKANDNYKPEEVSEKIIELFSTTKNNKDLVEYVIAKGRLI